MHDSASPHRKLRVFWIVAGLALLCLAWFCYQLFGPNPSILVSKETTFITEPLGPDGLPNYEAYYLRLGSEGITPENNAAVLTWQALWPGELSQEHWLPLCDALGMNKVPSQQESLVSPYDKAIRQQLALELAQRFSENPDGEAKEYYLSEAGLAQLREETADDIIGKAMDRPWTSEQLPALSQWAEENQQPLDLLIEASQRPRYYSPSPTLLNGVDESIFEVLLPGVQGMRRAARGLCARATWHIGEGRLDEAWRDLLACHRLARLVAQSNFLISQLVGIAIEGMALSADVALLGHEDLDAQLARQILDDLAALGPITDLAICLDNDERLGYLDFTVRLATGKLNADALGMFGVGQQIQFVAMAKIDWNSILRDGNRWYDQMTAAAKLPTRTDRQQAFNVIYDKLNQQTTQIRNGTSLVGGILSGHRRNQLVSAAIAGLVLPATSACSNAVDRNATRLELVRLAAALAIFRAEQGVYPEQLANLVPAVLPKLSLDTYSGKPFVYQRQDDGGYLLYSVFENEIDDQGTDMSGEIIDGEWVLQEYDGQPEGFDYSESDLVIRLPMPAFKIPPPPADEYGEYGGEYGEYGGQYAE